MSNSARVLTLLARQLLSVIPAVGIVVTAMIVAVRIIVIMAIMATVVMAVVMAVAMAVRPIAVADVTDSG